jgi:hypothetical protein
MNYDLIGFLIVLIFSLFITVAYVTKKFPAALSKVLLGGTLMRGLGSMLRYIVLYGIYNGGDAGRYFRYGSIYANQIWMLDFSFFDRAYWAYRQLWGTQAVMFISGFVTSLIGPTKKGSFLFFSLLAYAGTLFIIKAFQRNFPNSDVKKYAIWVLFWPSLWFWPSSIGKDALILLATGLVLYGSTTKRISWIALLAGIAIAAFIRPHVAGVLVVSVAVAHWISPTTKWTFVHVLQGLLVLVLLGFVLKTSLAHVGLEELDLENLKEYVDTVSTRTTQGGSAITSGGFGVKGIFVAFVNMLFRPFPWEAGSPLSAAASAEMIFYWAMVIRRRRRIITLLKEWRHNQLLRVAVPLTLLYVIMLGMTVGNLGIIARQRVHILPLLLIWLEARPRSTLPVKKSTQLVLARQT